MIIDPEYLEELENIDPVSEQTKILRDAEEIIDLDGFENVEEKDFLIYEDEKGDVHISTFKEIV